MAHHLTAQICYPNQYTVPRKPWSNFYMLSTTNKILSEEKYLSAVLAHWLCKNMQRYSQHTHHHSQWNYALLSCSGHWDCGLLLWWHCCWGMTRSDFWSFSSQKYSFVVLITTAWGQVWNYVFTFCVEKCFYFIFYCRVLKIQHHF